MTENRSALRLALMLNSLNCPDGQPITQDQVANLIERDAAAVSDYLHLSLYTDLEGDIEQAPPR